MSSNLIELVTENPVVANVLFSIRSEMKAEQRNSTYKAYIAEYGVTFANVNEHAKALAALITPVTDQAVNGKRTKYGNALNTAKTGLKRNLEAEEAEAKPVTLRATLSGEGGGTVVIEPDHPLYEQITALITGTEAE